MHMVGALEMSKIMSQVIVGYRTPPSIKKGNIFLKRLPPHPPLPPHYNVGGLGGWSFAGSMDGNRSQEKKIKSTLYFGGRGGGGGRSLDDGGSCDLPICMVVGVFGKLPFFMEGGVVLKTMVP